MPRNSGTRRFAFVEDKPTAETIQKQKGTSDCVICRFLPRGYLRVIVSIGLALRQMEKSPPAVAKLKDNIYEQYGGQGLRAAELVQIGIVSQLLARLAKIYSNPKDVERRLVAFLEQVEQLATWVSKEDIKDFKRVADLVRVRVDTNASQMVILLGRAEKATAAVLRILHDLKSDPRKYHIEIDQSGYQTTAYVFSPEIRARLADRWDAVAK